jgi:hypothetical protein
MKVGTIAEERTLRSPHGSAGSEHSLVGALPMISCPECECIAMLLRGAEVAFELVAVSLQHIIIGWLLQFEYATTTPMTLGRSTDYLTERWLHARMGDGGQDPRPRLNADWVLRQRGRVHVTQDNRRRLLRVTAEVDGLGR